ncbi:hypothetical protein [Nocardia salmonicida]|uniref:hypothetical protein n=1 Tax=Nocardia salmonicida TaxID=53431 RepID=UPI0033E93F6C
MVGSYAHRARPAIDKEHAIIKRIAVAAILTAAVAGATAAPALAVSIDQDPAATVTAPINPISATLQKFIAGLSFLGGQELPGCNIPTGC